jgi:polygalacturonase
VESLPSYPTQSANTSPRLAAIIYGSHLTNVTIQGEGTINGDGSKWWSRKDIPYTFPSLIQLRYSSNIVIRGVALQNSPWYFASFHHVTTSRRHLIN